MTSLQYENPHALGKCNCGTVRFGILCPITNVYVCHCSICRAYSSSSNFAVVVVPKQKFNWTLGEEFDDSGLLLNHLFDLDDALFTKEHFIVHEESGHTERASLGCLLSVIEQRVFNRLSLDGLDQRSGIQAR